MFRFANLGVSHSIANVIRTRPYLGATLLGGVATASLGFAWYSKAFAAEKKLALNPDEWREFKLKERKKVSHNTSTYRFALQSPEHELDLPVASFIMVQQDLGEEKPVVRPYTPITYDEKGYFDLIIKTYPNGKISKWGMNSKKKDPSKNLNTSLT